MKEQVQHLWQENNDFGWTWMALYWSAGACVGAMCGYLQLPPLPSFLTILHRDANYYYLCVLVVTLTCQPCLVLRFGSFGRPKNWTAILVFSLFNGLLETVLFLASYDTGKWIAIQIFHADASSWYARISGFTVFMIYSALIHVLFWLPYAFPRHVLPDAPPFHTTMLPALVLMSLAWIMLYEITNDVVAVCVLHFLTNAMGTWNMSLQPPSLGTRRQGPRTKDPRLKWLAS